MPDNETHDAPAFSRWAGILLLSLTLFAGEPLAAEQLVDPGRTSLTGGTATKEGGRVAGGNALDIGTDQAQEPRLRLAGGIRIGVGFGGGGLGVYGAPGYGRSYCDQPGYCYPAPRVVREVAVPRRIKLRAATPKAAQTRRKVRAVQSPKPKSRVVRSIASASEAGAPGTPGRIARGGPPVAVGDSTGGGRATPQFRGGPRGVGPITVGEASGGGRLTPSFRTVPSGGGRAIPTVRTTPERGRRR